MLKNTFRHTVFAAVLLMLTAFSANAQTEANAQQELRQRVDKVIESVMAALQLNTEDFNTHIAEMNNVRPLELQNLDSAHVAQNLVVGVRFLEFLKHTERAVDSLSQALQDSIFAIEQSMPPGVEEKSLVAFGESQAADCKAFDVHVGTLSKLYSQVLDVLGFLHHTNYQVGKSGLAIPSKDDAAQYTKLMKVIDATTVELKKTSEASQKATAWANKKIAEFNAAQNAAANPSSGGADKTKKRTSKK